MTLCVCVHMRDACVMLWDFELQTANPDILQYIANKNSKLENQEATIFSLQKYVT